MLKTLSQRYEKRKGGYSRVIRAGFRYGDDAPMAIIELVDRDVQAKKIDIKKTANIDGVLNQKVLSIEEGATLKIKTETYK